MLPGLEIAGDWTLNQPVESVNKIILVDLRLPLRRIDLIFKIDTA